MPESSTAPADIWRLQEYLTEHRKTVDRLYRYSYSGLLFIFSILMRGGWFTDADLFGLQPEKSSQIRLCATLKVPGPRRPPWSLLSSRFAAFPVTIIPSSRDLALLIVPPPDPS